MIYIFSYSFPRAFGRRESVVYAYQISKLVAKSGKHPLGVKPLSFPRWFYMTKNFEVLDILLVEDNRDHIELITSELAESRWIKGIRVTKDGEENPHLTSPVFQSPPRGKGLHQFERIVANVDQMNRLVGDLMKLSRVGKTAEQPREVDTLSLAKEIVEELNL